MTTPLTQVIDDLVTLKAKVTAHPEGASSLIQQLIDTYERRFTDDIGQLEVTLYTRFCVNCGTPLEDYEGPYCYRCEHDDDPV